MGSDSFGVMHWIQLIQAEYREVPGLNLTKPQMRRLWCLDEMVCDALIDALVASSVLKPSVRGTYVLADRSVMRLANIWPETPGFAEEPELTDAGRRAGGEFAAPQLTPEERPWWHRITAVPHCPLRPMIDAEPTELGDRPPAHDSRRLSRA